MAVYSCSASVIGRASGRSAVASAAYRSGGKLADERQGVVWDFTRKRGVLHAELVLREGDAPAWARDRERLWNEAEAREEKSTRRATATVAREFRLALPHELSAEARLEAARDLARFLAERYGTAVDLAIHAPDRHGDARNHHAHLMMTDRRLELDGFGAKVRELNKATGGRSEIEIIRQQWEEI